MVAPKKEKLAAAEGEYSELMTGLNQKKAELSAVEANLAALNAKLTEMQVCQQAVPICILSPCGPTCRHHVLHSQQYSTLAVLFSTACQEC